MPSKRQSLSGLSQSKPVLSHAAPSTVGRKKNFELTIAPAQTLWHNETINLHYGDSLNLYQAWDAPTVIISDGAYGVLGFDGDPTNHQDLPDWYEPHIQAWTERALLWTTLWFWNSETWLGCGASSFGALWLALCGHKYLG
nr:hypothetical protein [Herpetosiphon sp.]